MSEPNERFDVAYGLLQSFAFSKIATTSQYSGRYVGFAAESLVVHVAPIGTVNIVAFDLNGRRFDFCNTGRPLGADKIFVIVENGKPLRLGDMPDGMAGMVTQAFRLRGEWCALDEEDLGDAAK